MTAEECHKTENVDLHKLISHAESSVVGVHQLMAQETDPTRLAGLGQLAVSLAHHSQVLVAKKTELEVSNLTTSQSGMTGTTGCSCTAQLTLVAAYFINSQ